MADIVKRHAMTVADVEGDQNVQLGQELSNVEFGDLVRNVAMGIAEAQFALDQSSVRVAEMMSGNRILRNQNGDLLNSQGKVSTDPTEVPVIFDSRVYFGWNKIGDQRIPQKLSMMELGFVPNFYSFVETVMEMKIDINITRHAELQDNREYTAEDGGIPETLSESSSGYSHGGWFGSSGDSHTKITRTKVRATPVNTTYSSKFDYTAHGSSLVRTELRPVEAPALLQERVRELMAQERAEFLDAEIAKDEEAGAEEKAEEGEGAS